MGSFNTTCFASGQTIKPRDEVVIFPISQSSTYNPVKIIVKDGIKELYGNSNSRCNSSAFYKYAGPMLRGVYADYGRFDLNEDKNNVRNLVKFFNILYELCAQTENGKNPIHEKSFNFQELYNPKNVYDIKSLMSIWSAFFDEVQKSRVFLHEMYGPKMLDFAVMHEVTQEYLFDEMNKGEYEYPKYLKDVISSSNQFRYLNFSRVIGECNDCRMSSFYDSDEAFDLVQDFKEEQREEVIDSLVELYEDYVIHCYVNFGLNRLNIKLSPMVYNGQDYDNSVGKDFAKMVRKVSAEINRQIEEDRY